MRLPRLGTLTAKRVVSASLSGQPNRVRGTPSPGTFSQCPSIAAILAGWCFSVFRPCRSPTKAWMGATARIMPTPMANILRTAAFLLPRSICQAAEPATISAVARKAAITMWVRR